MKKIKGQGIQRASLTTCMTCIQTMKRHSLQPYGAEITAKGWADDPSAVMARACEHRWMRGQRGRQFDNELLALEYLYRQHTAEYEAALAALNSGIPASWALIEGGAE